MNMVAEVTVNTAGELALLIFHELLESITSQSFVFLMVNLMFLCAVQYVTCKHRTWHSQKLKKLYILCFSKTSHNSIYRLISK